MNCPASLSKKHEAPLRYASSSSSLHLSCCWASGLCAAADAFYSLRLLATEAHALDETTRKVVEKLLKAAAKRRELDACSSSAEPQQERHQQTTEQQEPQRWRERKQPEREPQRLETKREKQIAAATAVQGVQLSLRQVSRPQEQQREQLQQLLQEQLHQQPLQEDDVLVFWSELMSQQKARADADSVAAFARSLRGRKGESRRLFGAQANLIAADEAKKRWTAAAIEEAPSAKEKEEKEKAAVLPERAKGEDEEEEKINKRELLSLPSVVCGAAKDGEKPRTSVIAELTRRQQGAPSPPAATGAAATLLEMERLLATLQQQLNRLYNIAVHSQQIVSDLQCNVSRPAAALQAAAAAETAAAGAAAAASAAAAGGGATAVASSANETAAAAAANTMLIGEYAVATAEDPAAVPLTASATPSARQVVAAPPSRAAWDGKEKEDERKNTEGGGKEHAQSNGADNQVEADENRGDASSLRNCKGDEEAKGDARVWANAPPALSVGAGSASAADRADALVNQYQRVERDQLQQQPHPQEDQMQRVQQVQRQQAWHILTLETEDPQPPPRVSQEQQAAWQQQQRSLQQQQELPDPRLAAGAAVALQRHEPQQQCQCDVGGEEQQENRRHWMDFISLLKVCEVLVRTIADDWRFKQEVKEELHFAAPMGVFLAARAAWCSKPYIADLPSLLRDAAPLAEKCKQSTRQQHNGQKRRAAAAEGRRGR